MKIQVLDHGYVELIECWGTGKDGVEDPHDAQSDFEVGIIEAARQSTQGSFRGWEQDGKLLKFLAEHDHSTPFEFAGMVIEVQAPIFVFREWHRHRTQSYNEMSARYAPLPDLYYVPRGISLIERFNAARASSNKQASSLSDLGDTEISSFQIGSWLHELEEQYARCEELYQKALQLGVPKELARLVMPVGHYSKMRASANLRNWLGFLTLRTDKAAQWEIRQFANAVAEIVKINFPRTYELWDKGS